MNPAAMTERLIDAAIYNEQASGAYKAGARKELNEARAAIETALENSKARLADAHTNPASSDLSSLRKGAEDLRTAIEDAIEKLNTYRGAAVQTVIDQLEAALVSGSREDGE